MVAALERDARRFADHLGPAHDVARLGRIITTASLLGVVVPSGLDHQSDPEPDRQLEPELDDHTSDDSTGLDVAAGGAPTPADSAEADSAEEGSADEGSADEGSADEAHDAEDRAAEVGGSLAVGATELPEAPVFELPEVPQGPPPAADDVRTTDDA